MHCARHTVGKLHLCSFVKELPPAQQLAFQEWEARKHACVRIQRQGNGRAALQRGDFQGGSESGGQSQEPWRSDSRMAWHPAVRHPIHGGSPHIVFIYQPQTYCIYIYTHIYVYVCTATLYQLSSDLVSTFSLTCISHRPA